MRTVPSRLPAVAFLAFLALAAQAAPTPDRPPNVLVILADDLGYGDVRCFNPEHGKIPTPNLDRLAREGMMFTDGHSSSGVCSPSRYTLLTGRYHWRTRLQSGIVGVWGPPLIAPDRLTIAGLLKARGYRTACIGKWHLGRDWPIGADERKFLAGLGGKAGGGGTDLAKTATDAHRAAWQSIFSKPIPGGPTARGFDLAFGTDVPNWPPYCFIENDRTVGIPSTLLPAALLRNNMASLQGPALEGWTLESILPALADRACAWIGERAKEDAPFFLYLPLTSPHTPLAVNAPWKGKSGLNPLADFVMETDAAVGRVLEALEKSGAAGRTLVVFTSDNGCASYAGGSELVTLGHAASGPFRGFKGDAWEGGHRVPFIVRWPGTVKPGTRCAQTVGHVDLMATCADLAGATLPDTAGEDSVSLLPLLKGGDRPIHEAVVHHAMSGRFAIREGAWKLILGPGGGGSWSQPNDAAALKQGLPPIQLYDLGADAGERNNLHSAHPDVVERLTARLEQLVADGRSTPGAPQKNDVAVDVRKAGAKRP